MDRTAPLLLLMLTPASATTCWRSSSTEEAPTSPEASVLKAMKGALYAGQDRRQRRTHGCTGGKQESGQAKKASWLERCESQSHGQFWVCACCGCQQHAGQGRPLISPQDARQKPYPTSGQHTCPFCSPLEHRRLPGLCVAGLCDIVVCEKLAVGLAQVSTGRCADNIRGRNQVRATVGKVPCIVLNLLG